MKECDFMDKYEELLLKEEFNKVEVEVKDLLDRDSENPRLWYLLFLSQNNNYINFDKYYIKNELALNKALEYSSIKDEAKLKYEFNLYSNLNIKGLDKLLRYYQFKEYNKCKDKLMELSNTDNKVDNINDKFVEALDYMFSFVDNVDESKIQLLILKYIYLCSNDNKIKDLIDRKSNSSIYKDSIIDLSKINNLTILNRYLTTGKIEEEYVIVKEENNYNNSNRENYNNTTNNNASTKSNSTEIIVTILLIAFGGCFGVIIAIILHSTVFKKN